MKFLADRTVAKPDAASRKLLVSVRSSIAESGLRDAYTGVTNTAVTDAGGNVAEYSIGMRHRAKVDWS